MHETSTVFPSIKTQTPGFENFPHIPSMKSWNKLVNNLYDTVRQNRITKSDFSYSVKEKKRGTSDAGLLLVIVYFPPVVFSRLLKDLSHPATILHCIKWVSTALKWCKIWGSNQTFGLASNWTCCPLLSSQFSPKLLPVFNDTRRGVSAAGPQYPLGDELSEALKHYPLSDQSTGCFLQDCITGIQHTGHFGRHFLRNYFIY